MNQLSRFPTFGPTILLLFNLLGCNAEPLNEGHILKSRAVGDVEWHQCPDVADTRIGCGTFVVPLDYFDAGAGSATIALSKFKAQSSPKKGTVFIGAGGPGDLGTSIPIQIGEFFSSSRIGTDCDIIGFDHRGMGATTPTVKCFRSEEERNIFYRNTVFELGYTQPPNVTKDPYARFDLILQYRQDTPMFETQAKLCTINMPNGGADLKYMGSSTVARDIEYMSRILTGADTPINFYGALMAPYWAYTWLTCQPSTKWLLRFPNRVGRVAIDGIADPVSWTSFHSYEYIDGWLNQTEANYDWFLKACIQAGPATCALATGKNTAEGLKTEIEAFFDKLYSHPLASPNSTSPAHLTSGAARSALFLGLLRPRTWPTVASDLKKAMNGDPVPLLNDFILPDFSLNGLDTKMARYAVTCLDSLPFKGPASGPTAEKLADLAINRIRKISPHFGVSATLSEPDGGCEFWPVKGVERFTGPWNHTLAFPVLIASTSVDPVTPLTSAKLVNRLLGNSSRLLVQHGLGHVTIAGVSTCTTNVFLAYFGNGTLPENETVCETDTQPFGLSSAISLTEGAKALSKRMEELTDRLLYSGRLF